MKVKGERLQETGGQVGLKINFQKTKEMQIGVRQQEPLGLHGEAVERVSEFTYLGSIINETGGADEDQDKESTIDILDAYACVERKMYYIVDCKQSSGFRYEREVCPSVWLGNLEIDVTTDQEIADIYQQVFKDDLEYPFARGHLKWRTMGKDTSEPYRRKYQEKKVEMDWAYATEAWE